MPLYEFRCRRCGQLSSFRTSGYEPPADPVCASCGAGGLRRIFSGVNVTHSGSDTDRAHPRAVPGGVSADPRSIGGWAEQRLSELGVSLGSEGGTGSLAEVGGLIERARDGDTSFLDAHGFLSGDHD